MDPQRTEDLREEVGVRESREGAPQCCVSRVFVMTIITLHIFPLANLR